MYKLPFWLWGRKLPHLLLKIKLDWNNFLYMINLMEVKDKKDSSLLIDIILKSIPKHGINEKFSLLFNILNFKRCIVIIHSVIDDKIDTFYFSKHGEEKWLDLSPQDLKEILRFKNVFVKKSTLPILPFDYTYIYNNVVENDKEIIIICECDEREKGYDDDIKILEFFSTCYSSILKKLRLELTEQSHKSIIDSIREGIVAIRDGIVLMKNKLGEEIISNFPEILHENFYGERILNLFVKDELRSIHYERKRVNDVDILIFEDITEKSKMMNSVIKMKNFHILGELTAGVAHEINNPLQIILGLSQLIDISGKNLDDETKKYIDMIKDSSIRIKKVVEFLSSYMEHTKLIKEDRLFRISKSIKSAYDAVFNLENMLGINLSYNIIDDFVVNGDLHKVVIAIENLILNSFDAIKAKGGEGHILIRSFIEKNKGIVEVEDDGIGIKEEVIPKIFDTFFTTKKNGTGLGLGIVRRVMLMHKGDVKLLKTGGGKTIFRLTFPIEYEEKSVNN